MFLAIAGVAAFGAPLASDEPDGLQRVARDEAFAAAEQEHALEDAPLAGYAVDGIEDEDVSTGLSGVAGVVLAFAAATAVFALLARRHRGAGS